MRWFRFRYLSMNINLCVIVFTTIVPSTILDEKAEFNTIIRKTNKLHSIPTDTINRLDTKQLPKALLPLSWNPGFKPNTLKCSLAILQS